MGAQERIAATRGEGDDHIKAYICRGDSRKLREDCTDEPLESGRTTDINLAPQLVTLTEKSPSLSSYTPTFVASAPVVACAPRDREEAARHSSARS